MTSHENKELPLTAVASLEDEAIAMCLRSILS